MPGVLSKGQWELQGEVPQPLRWAWKAEERKALEINSEDRASCDKGFRVKKKAQGENGDSFANGHSLPL